MNTDECLSRGTLTRLTPAIYFGQTLFIRTYTRHSQTEFLPKTQFFYQVTHLRKSYLE